MSPVQDDPSSGIPWGRPPVPDIAVPPFDDRRAARSFVANLCAYVALLGGVGPVSATTFALLTTVQREVDDIGRTVPFDPLPSPHVLTLAMVTYFPAPWTPHGLNDVIGDVLTPRDRGRRTSASMMAWEIDPRFVAARSGSGDWEVTASERGRDRLVGRIAGDDDMVLYRMSFARTHPMPFGWSWDDSNMDALERAAVAARTAWTAHAQLPYLADWRH